MLYLVCAATALHNCSLLSMFNHCQVFCMCCHEIKWKIPFNAFLEAKLLFAIMMSSNASDAHNVAVSLSGLLITLATVISTFCSACSSSVLRNDDNDNNNTTMRLSNPLRPHLQIEIVYRRELLLSVEALCIVCCPGFPGLAGVPHISKAPSFGQMASNS